MLVLEKKVKGQVQLETFCFCVPWVCLCSLQQAGMKCCFLPGVAKTKNSLVVFAFDLSPH